MWFAYRKVEEVIGGFANDLNIKDHDLAKSLAQELTKTILTKHGYQSVPTLLADVAVTFIGKMAMIFASQKEGKAKTPDAEKRRLIKC